MVCPKIPQIKYYEFSDIIHNKVIANQIPVNGAIELTLRCNLRCAHCYCSLDKSRKELTAIQWKTIIDELVENGCLWLLITGGEPLLREDFLDIYMHAKKRGLLINLFTNGTLITDEIAKTLIKFKPFRLEITVYGSNEMVFDNVCEIKGAFKKFIKGLAILEEHNVKYHLKTLVTKDNFEDFDELINFMKMKSTDYRFDSSINPRFDGDMTPLTKRLQPSYVVEIEKQDIQSKKAWEKAKEENTMKLDRNTDALLCSSGIDSFNISPYGDLQYCVTLREPFYNLLEGSFSDGWEYLKKIRKDMPKIDSQCWGCDAAVFCDSCPGWSLLENKDFLSPSQFLCDVAKKRYNAFVVRDSLKRRENE